MLWSRFCADARAEVNRSLSREPHRRRLSATQRGFLTDKSQLHLQTCLAQEMQPFDRVARGDGLAVWQLAVP